MTRQEAREGLLVRVPGIGKGRVIRVGTKGVRVRIDVENNPFNRPLDIVTSYTWRQARLGLKVVA